jgi:hypothetical protein
MAKTTMFERSHTKVRFANEDMDYLFQVVLGYHTYGGASFGARPLDPNPDAIACNSEQSRE